MIFPNIKIDLITVFLVALAMIPWLESLFKSVELPGGLKLEFHDLKRVELEAKDVGLIEENQEEKTENDDITQKYNFIELADKNLGLALTSFRIEVEKRLRQIAERYSIDTHRSSMSKILQTLTQKAILSVQENSTIRDMIYTLNQASHGIEYDDRIAEWIIENGPKILKSLDNKIFIRGGSFSNSDPNSSKHLIEQSFENQNWSTNREWSDHIEHHKHLWDKEIENLCNSIITKLNEDTEKIQKFSATQNNWEEQIKLEGAFLRSIPNLTAKIGREGQMITLTTILEKYKMRALELEELLALIDE